MIINLLHLIITRLIFFCQKDVKKRFDPFMAEVMAEAGDNVHSVYLIGSALTTDFNPSHSDINSILMLLKMDLKLLERLAPLGKKYGKKGIAAPLIMTPAYVEKSLDVFPIEFLNIKLIHHCLSGEDIFNDVSISRSDLRRQCERELKIRKIRLRQQYIHAAGDKKILTHEFFSSFSGYIPLFRGIIALYGNDPPVTNAEVLKALEDVTNVNAGAFKRVMREKQQRSRLSLEQLNTLFEDYDAAIKKLGDMIDEMEV